MGSLRRALGGLMVAASIAMLGIIVPAYALLPDRLAALTVFPIWIWAGAGIGLGALASGLMAARFGLWVAAAWLGVVLVGTDEAQIWQSLSTERPQLGAVVPFDGKPLIRVVTLNCAHFGFGNPAEDLAKWQPDIVLLQEVFPSQVKQIERALYGETGDSCYSGTNGIVTRWKMGRQLHQARIRVQQATVLLPNDEAIEIVNVHLTSAVTDVRLHRRETWQAHLENRLRRRAQMDAALRQLRRSTPVEGVATILGGDFNANATDRAHRDLPPRFIDSFATVGHGWGNTFHRRFPVLRIDFLYLSDKRLTARRCMAHTTVHSDHRMVIADIEMR